MDARVGTSPLLLKKLIPFVLAAHCGAAHGAIGRSPGTFDVSAAGTAQYTIPLWTPPAAGGIRPDLSISYSHARENGLLGMGFEITGFSVITRCPKTIVQDGADAPITLTAADVFCLDNERLRLESGTPYGAPGTTYRTEKESFARVTANGSAGTGPANRCDRIQHLCNTLHARRT